MGDAALGGLDSPYIMCYNYNIITIIERITYMSDNITSSQVRMPKDLYEQLRTLSYVKRIPINTIMVKAIQEYMNVNSIQVSIKSK